MNKRGHTIGGVLASSASVYLMHKGFLNESLIVTGIMIASFVPDIDAEHSYIQSKLPFLKLFHKLNDILPQNNITCHRGAFFHSVWTLIPFIYLYKINIILGLGIGILGHHILDMTTVAGLRYFYPFKMKLRIWR